MAAARSTKRAQAEYCDKASGAGSCARSGSAKGRTASSCSPESRNAARLVTRSFSHGQAESRSARGGGSGQDLLEVVEQQQERMVSEGCLQDLQGRARVSLPQLKSL